MSDPSGITPDETKEQKPTINLKVKINKDGSEVFFRIKPTTKLNKVIDALCTKRSLDRNSLVFIFDGDHINGKKTAAEHHMEDGDEIDVFLLTDGGSVTFKLVMMN
ncbi:small ubiquitin-related modifier 1-like [Pyrus communis]|uniref:small ubiquitin-related modifier 1-like n=1 Tax=Pyrus communis TaxID=23211 RepID=UPI0035C1AD71